MNEKFEFDRSLTAHNLGSVRNAPRKVQFIVLHDTAGAGTVNDAKYLASNNDPGVSVDFVILKDGTIYKLNPDLVRYFCIHAGRKTRFRGYVGPECNRRSVGIEISQKASFVEYPDIQVKAVAYTVHWLCVNLGLTKKDITTHKDIITDGSRTDPRSFPWTKFWDYFNEFASGVESKEGDVSVLSRPVTHTVIRGNTLWGLAKKYATTVEKIKSLNKLDTRDNTLTVGQILIVKE